MIPSLRPSLVSLAACGLLAGFAGAQQQLTVGPGQQFGTIPAAIHAASPGDTILVQPGTYGGFVVSKGVRIIGRNALIVGGGVFGTVLVQGVPAGESFALVGFGVDAPGDCQVVNCRGQVALRDLHQGGGFPWGLQVFGSDQVHVAASPLRNGGVTDSTVVLEGCSMDPSVLMGLQVSGGVTVLESCTVRGSTGPFTGPGVQLNRGTLVATGSTIRGTGSSPAIRAIDGQMLLDPSVTLIADPGIATIVGPVTPVPFAFASQSAGTDGVQLSIQGQGLAGGVFGMLVSQPGPQTPTPIGVSWLDPGSAALLYFDTWAPDRSHTRTIPHPPLPPGLTITLQVLYAQPSGLALGTPSVVVVP
ncbi:MAG: hypothetical protein AB7O97_04215 [Planctomycetota bacterium]